MNYKELKQIIQKHNQAYYDNSASMITDAEYDQLYDKLENMEKAQGWRDHDSPTKHVGGAAGKVTHPYKLYSLRKIYEGEEELESWMNVKLPKIDGTNLTLIYRRGKLKMGLTRGNGEQGTDVTHLIGMLKGAPTRIDLDYDEDSTADTDANFVLTGTGDIVEIQATAEGAAFDEAAFMELMRLARQSIGALVTQQNEAVAR